jgi:hypothetical protein
MKFNDLIEIPKTDKHYIIPEYTLKQLLRFTTYYATLKMPKNAEMVITDNQLQSIIEGMIENEMILFMSTEKIEFIEKKDIK